MTTQLAHTPNKQAAIIRITVDSRADLDHKLEAGVSLLQRQATSLGCTQGILVTRHSIRDFTVELHAEVPFGMTCERQSW